VAVLSMIQNEILPNHVVMMVKNGARLFAEGAKMPATNETIALCTENGIFF
jgi:glutamate dehydrogenase (NADP+)